ncbi:MAG: HAD family hydrolase [Anaerolineales bacterium]
MSSNQYKRIVIFDFDGVLGDTLGDMLRFSDQVAIELGIHHHTTLHDLEVLQPMSFANLGRQIGLPETEIERYVQKMIELFETSPIPCPIFPGMADVVAKLKDDSILSIVSGNTTTVIQRFLEYYGLAHAFNKIYGVDIMGGKVEKIKRIISEVNQPNLPALMIGDAASDVEAAHQAGIIGIAVGWGHQPQHKLLQAHPDYFVKTPQELLEKILTIKVDS